MHGCRHRHRQLQLSGVEIRPSAHRHGISDDDIRHAVDHAIAALTSPAQPDFTMVIGPDRAVRLLEVGLVQSDDQDYVIHAMSARDKYVRIIEPHRGDQR